MKEFVHIPPDWGASGFIVAIPAKNEADRLPLALAALAREGHLDVIVIANGCSDGTARIARATRGVAVLETGRMPGGVGEARRRGMQLAIDIAPRAGILATTDADCIVAAGWAQIIRSVLDHADVACGRVIPDPEEFARLPGIVRRHGTLEDDVSALRAELDGMRMPNPYDPLPRHGQTPGASIAFRMKTYLDSGGFDAVRCDEDRRIVARIEASGGRVARPWELSVTASCRLDGRAPGGMATTISARASDQAQLAKDITRLRNTADALRETIALQRLSQISATAPQVNAEQSLS